MDIYIQAKYRVKSSEE